MLDICPRACETSQNNSKKSIDDKSYQISTSIYSMLRITGHLIKQAAARIFIMRGEAHKLSEWAIEKSGIVGL